VGDLGTEVRIIFKINLKIIIYGSVDCIHMVEVRGQWHAVLDTSVFIQSRKFYDMLSILKFIT
jgi:hypothetical protein